MSLVADEPSSDSDFAAQAAPSAQTNISSLPATKLGIDFSAISFYDESSETKDKKRKKRKKKKKKKKGHKQEPVQSGHKRGREHDGPNLSDLRKRVRTGSTGSDVNDALPLPSSEAALSWTGAVMARGGELDRRAERQQRTMTAHVNGGNTSQDGRQGMSGVVDSRASNALLSAASSKLIDRSEEPVAMQDEVVSLSELTKSGGPSRGASLMSKASKRSVILSVLSAPTASGDRKEEDAPSKSVEGAARRSSILSVGATMHARLSAMGKRGRVRITEDFASWSRQKRKPA